MGRASPYPVHAEPLKLGRLTEETEAVAVGKAGGASHGKRVAPHILDRSHELAEGFGRVERRDVGATAIGKVGGVAAIEGLLEIGGESIGATPQRGTTVQVGMATDNLVEALAVGGGDVLDVCHVLQAPLYLERRGASLSQCLEVVNLTEVLERQQVAVVLDDTPVAVDEVELHAADLCTLAAIGGATEAVLRGIALSAVADTESTVDKDLQLDIGHGLVDGTNLVDREFACQHDPTETQVAQPRHLLSRAIVGLCRGVIIEEFSRYEVRGTRCEITISA